MPAVLQWDSFGGVMPAIDAARLPAGAAQIAENTLFRNGGVTGLPAARGAYFASVDGTRSVVPFGDGWREFAFDARWVELEDRAIVCGGDYVQWISGADDVGRVGFALARAYAGGATAAATAERTQGAGTNGHEYSFYVEFENQWGDVSELQGPIYVGGDDKDLLASGDTATVTLAAPVAQAGEDFSYINVYALSGGAEPSLVHRVAWTGGNAPAAFTFTPADDYPGQVTRQLFDNETAEGRRTTLPALKKMVYHEGGFWVGFYDRYVCFSRIGRVGSFPFDWELDMRFVIDDIVEFGNEIYVFGRGHAPVLVRVTAPPTAYVVPMETDFVYVGGAARGNFGVVYMTGAGLMHTAQGLLTQGAWDDKSAPAPIEAASSGNVYFWRDADGGGMVDFRAVAAGGASAITMFDYGTPGQVYADGSKVYFLVERNLLEVDFGGDAAAGSWKWRSGVQRLEMPINLGAARVFSRCPDVSAEVYINGPGEIEVPFLPGLGSRRGERLVRRYGVEDRKCHSRLRVYGDGELLLDEEVEQEAQGHVASLPGAVQAIEWEVELEGQDEVTRVELAVSRADLGV